MTRTKWMTVAVLTAVVVVAAPGAASAFCGFYIDTGGNKLVNDATQVVLMRKGTRTVLSMQNNYKGPPEAFALVIPVPTVLQKEDVKTLPEEVFGRVDTMGAPRLVEYWERDPCEPETDPRMVKMSRRADSAAEPAPPSGPRDLGVTVEAKFEVGEYQIVILSAKQSTGLDT